MAAPRQPVVVGFFCTWCAYRAADLAGVTRTSFSAGLRPIRVVCSGRVEPEMVLKALALGASGVLIVGCHPGGCHSVDGNIKAARRVALLRTMLTQLGVEAERVELVFTGASEGAHLAETVNRFAGRIAALGPLRRTGGEPEIPEGAFADLADPGPTLERR